MADPDASSIKFWLDFAIRKLGSRAVIRRIAYQIDTNPDVVDKALYWLPSLVPKSEDGARSALKELHREAKSRNIIRGAQMTAQSDGTVLFSNVHPENRS
ncbi:MAG: hypothetical protein MI807_17925 [Verrucomicrobiales bacterium]|nr:hypothetical protein [Verrucomicrobiales bacterium]